MGKKRLWESAVPLHEAAVGWAFSESRAVQPRRSTPFLRLLRNSKELLFLHGCASTGTEEKKTVQSFYYLFAVRSQAAVSFCDPIERLLIKNCYFRMKTANDTAQKAQTPAGVGVYHGEWGSA